MSTNEIASGAGNSSAPVAKDAPTEQQASQAGAPKRFEKGQTVCNEKNDKGKLHNGHLKQVSPIREEARKHMRGDDLLYRCQTCGALYMGPPLGHVRDPRKQARYVQSELVDILEAAGGTLPAFKKTETGAWVQVSANAPHAATPAPAAQTPAKPAAAKPAPSAAPAAATPAAAAGGETPEEKRARIIAEAKAKAAARMAGGAPVKSESPTAPPPAAAATGDAASDETPEQKRARMMAEIKAKAAAKMAGKGGAAATTMTPSATPATGGETPATPQPPTPTAAPPAAAAAMPAAVDVPSDETPEQKRVRMMAEIKAKAAAKMAARNSSSGAKVGGETSIDMPPTTAQPPSPTSGTDSSSAADAHRPAAEAQAATGQASAAPLSPAAATASPAAGAETPADLAPDASTELTPGAPRDERATDEGANR
jgi:hypothetical protein